MSRFVSSPRVSMRSRRRFVSSSRAFSSTLVSSSRVLMSFLASSSPAVRVVEPRAPGRFWCRRSGGSCRRAACSCRFWRRRSGGSCRRAGGSWLRIISPRNVPRIAIIPTALPTIDVTIVVVSLIFKLPYHAAAVADSAGGFRLPAAGVRRVAQFPTTVPAASPIPPVNSIVSEPCHRTLTTATTPTPCRLVAAG